jgi:hypothetical protein
MLSFDFIKIPPNVNILNKRFYIEELYGLGRNFFYVVPHLGNTHPVGLLSQRGMDPYPCGYLGIAKARVRVGYQNDYTFLITLLPWEVS